jgi:hypothetical protein
MAMSPAAAMMGNHVSASSTLTARRSNFVGAKVVRSVAPRPTAAVEVSTQAMSAEEPGRFAGGARGARVRMGEIY